MSQSTSNTGTVSTTDGVSLYYRIDGPENAPWLILSNSLATDIRMWDPQLDLFTSSHRVLRYDSRGHGNSGLSPAGFSFTTLASDVVQLMDSLDIRTADMAGISMGGMTGLATALLAPDRIRRLVCCDARADAPDMYRAIWDGNIARLHEGGIGPLCEPTMERWFTTSFRDDPVNAATLDLVRDMISKTPDAGYELAARCLQSLDLLPHLGDIRCPTLYIVGEEDPAAPIAVMQDMADKTPDGRLVIIREAAHLSNIEQPAAFSKAVSSFLNAD